MRVIVTSAEIAQYRSALSSLPEALMALDVIEDCEGDLDDAAISLAIHAGQQPTTSDNWLDGFAKRWRPLVCRPTIQTDLAQGNLTEIVTLLATDMPAALVVPLIMYVTKLGSEEFCRALGEKLTPP